MTHRKLKSACSAIVLVMALVACAGPAADDPPTPTPVPTETEPAPTPSQPEPPARERSQPEVLVTGLAAPWSIAFYGETALVSERDSTRLLELDSQGNAREIGTIDAAAPRGEGGLLGIAVHGDHLYAYFTTNDDNRVERFALSGEPGALALGESETLLSGIPAASYHNGGRIAFGPDDMLYVTTGDAGNTALSQQRDSLAGKILRLSPDGAVPADNPFQDSYVYSYGHRNPQGIAWAEDGTLYASEFGRDTWDELNIIEAGGNYGWPEVEGIAEDDAYIDPVQQWETSEASPSGIAIVGDSVYIANLRGERLREVPLSAPETSHEHFVGEYGRLREVTISPDGALWVLTNNTDGRGSPSENDDRIISLPVDAPTG